MITGTILGFIGVGALLLASLVLAVNSKKHPGLSKIALTLFIGAFIGGVVVTLLGAVAPRDEKMEIATIGKVDPQEQQALEKKVATDPNDVKSRERLGHIYLQEQNFEGTFQMAHEVLKLDPRSVESRAHLGMILFAMQRRDEALQQINNALAIDPHFSEALLFKKIIQSQTVQSQN